MGHTRHSAADAEIIPAADQPINRGKKERAACERFPQWRLYEANRPSCCKMAGVVGNCFKVSAQAIRHQSEPLVVFLYFSAT